MSSFLLTARLWLSQFLTQESFLAPCPTGPTAPGEGAELLLLPGQAAGWGSRAAGGTGQPRPGIGHLPGDGTGTARLCAAQDLPRCGIAVAGGDGPGGLTWGGQGWGSYGEVGRDSQGWWCPRGSDLLYRSLKSCLLTSWFLFPHNCMANIVLWFLPKVVS